MTPRELLNPIELHPAPGYSHVAIAQGERLVFIAGQVALDTEMALVGGDDLYEQTRAATANVLKAPAAPGAAWSDVVRRTIYTTQPTAYELITRAIEAEAGSTEHPPQTILGVVGLGLPELLIEIECTAVLS